MIPLLYQLSYAALGREETSDPIGVAATSFCARRVADVRCGWEALSERSFHRARVFVPACR